MLVRYIINMSDTTKYVLFVIEIIFFYNIPLILCNFHFIYQRNALVWFTTLARRKPSCIGTLRKIYIKCLCI